MDAPEALNTLKQADTIGFGPVVAARVLENIAWWRSMTRTEQLSYVREVEAELAS